MAHEAGSIPFSKQRDAPKCNRKGEVFKGRRRKSNRKKRLFLVRSPSSGDRGVLLGEFLWEKERSHMHYLIDVDWKIPD